MLEDTRYFLQAVLMVVGALLPIVDPLGSAPTTIFGHTWSSNSSLVTKCPARSANSPGAAPVLVNAVDTDA